MTDSLVTGFSNLRHQHEKINLFFSKSIASDDDTTWNKVKGDSTSCKRLAWYLVSTIAIIVILSTENPRARIVMLSMSQKNTFSTRTSKASLPSSIPTILCLLVAIICVSNIHVDGFATTSQQVKRKSGLGLVPTSQDIAVSHTLYPSSSPSIASSISSPIHQTTEKTGLDYRLDISLSSSTSTTALLAVQSSESNIPDTKGMGANKKNFFASLDSMETLNDATKERSALLAKMIDEKQVVAVGSKGSGEMTISYEKPGSAETFLASGGTAPVAAGTWKVVYAPHMTTAMDIFRGRFDVTYDLFSDSRIISHAYYDFPIVGKGYLSVSGTYGSVANDSTDTYSCVDFDKAWIKALPSSASASTESPYDSLEAVPDSFLKTAINEIGKRAFIESVAVFPVSFLDDDTIVFEFEFLGTKICAHKV